MNLAENALRFNPRQRCDPIKRAGTVVGSKSEQALSRSRQLVRTVARAVCDRLENIRALFQPQAAIEPVLRQRQARVTQDLAFNAGVDDHQPSVCLVGADLPRQRTLQPRHRRKHPLLSAGQRRLGGCSTVCAEA